MRLIVNFDVPELASAIDFYSNALELQLSRIIDDDVAELGSMQPFINFETQEGSDWGCKFRNGIAPWLAHQ